MDVKAFLNSLYSEIRTIGIDPNAYNCDHICYRTATLENYRLKKQEFTENFRFLTETQVNGRPISAFFMKDPIRFENQTIHLIELPAPKPNKTTIEGLEHAEFVVKNLTDFQKQNSGITFDHSGMNKSNNPELELVLGKVNAKFHTQTLLEVIQDERLQELSKVDWKDPASSLKDNPACSRLLKAIDQSKVQEHFDTILTGTFPLLLNIKGSDLDFICNVDDLDIFKESLKSKYSHLKQFDLWETNRDQYIWCSFVIDDIPFEIFGQKNPVEEQKAYKHMIAEAKLMAVTGDWCKPHLIDLKAGGLKTEPAFAKFWNLTGDPYDILLEIAGISNDQLKAIAWTRLLG